MPLSHSPNNKTKITTRSTSQSAENANLNLVDINEALKLLSQTVNDSHLMLREDQNWKKKINSEISSLNNKVTSLKVEILQDLHDANLIITNRVNAVEAVMDTFQERLSRIELKINTSSNLDYDSRILTLEMRTDAAERSNRACNLIVGNLPIRCTDCTNDTDAIVKIGSYLQIKIDQSDLRLVSRIGLNQSDTINPLLISFRDELVRNKFFQAYLHKRDLNYVNCNIGLVRKRIYINEHLTPFNYSIFRAAQKLKAENKNIKRLQTRQGQVFVQFFNSAITKFTSTEALLSMANNNPSNQAVADIEHDNIKINDVITNNIDTED